MSITFFGSGRSAGTASVGITAAPFTICAWVKLASTGAKQFIAGFGSLAGLNEWHAIYVDSSNHVVAESSHVLTVASAISTSTLAANVWYHVCGVWNSSSDRSIYLNGVLEGGDIIPCVPTITTFRVGREPDNNDIAHFSGILDSVSVWNVALTAQQIQQLAVGYANPAFVCAESLMQHYPFDAPERQNIGENFARPLQDTLSGAGLTMRLIPTTITLKYSDDIAPWTRKHYSFAGRLATQAACYNSYECQSICFAREEEYKAGKAVYFSWVADQFGKVRYSLPDFGDYILWNCEAFSRASNVYDVKILNRRNIDQLHNNLLNLNPSGDFRFVADNIPLNKIGSIKLQSELELTISNAGMYASGIIKFFLVKDFT